jgi:hypothetical protein
MGMWKDAVLFGIPGYLALIVSIVLLVLGIQRYYLHLRMRVLRAFVVWYEDNVSIVLFDLAFVNPASRGKTVSNVKLRPPPVINDKEYPLVYDKNLEHAVCLSPNNNKTLAKFPPDQILQSPLDIPPHQSRCKLYSRCIGILVPEGDTISEHLPLPFHFYAFDIDDKQIAKCVVKMSLEKLRNPKIYVESYYVEVKA